MNELELLARDRIHERINSRSKDRSGIRRSSLLIALQIRTRRAHDSKRPFGALPVHSSPPNDDTLTTTATP